MKKNHINGRSMFLLAGEAYTQNGKHNGQFLRDNADLYISYRNMTCVLMPCSGKLSIR